jgi:TRAP-type mannitol/chloroaromatic compound transport system permease large subunit
MPSVVLVGGYIIYVLVVSYLDPQAAPIFKSNKCNITGREMTPIATTLAPTTPVEAASNEPTKMVETAKPPRTLPNKSPIASNSWASL